MRSSIADVLLTLRTKNGWTQEELAEKAGISQVALSRYENGLREPEPDVITRFTDIFGVTRDFLMHDFRMYGAIAVEAHMRRNKTTKATDWKRIEAELNMLRMQASFVLERLPLRVENEIPHFDPDEVSPADAAILLRTAWRMPIGPVRNLYRWVESAGSLIFEQDFGTQRIDGCSQWAGSHAVILLNKSFSTDRKRLTLAHELGHLVLHNDYVDPGIETQANKFAAEFLMPETVISSQLDNLNIAKLLALKALWGVSIQAIFERAYQLGKVSSAERTKFYKHLNSRGWKKHEPGGDAVPDEIPEFAFSIGETLQATGLSAGDIEAMLGVKPGEHSPFLKEKRVLSLV
ncbi:MAG: helix-turn-helix domain-containing protein [Mobiluncus sp.]|uniref:helix-turn-helix domain-containing protein n=1 Tax=Mobiluncus sp. TaxID=47293 RepID=UPI002582EF5F|nr:ImmA/IrrE family metallo-endopeptidase [Mobiluncus sp.]MCI6584236.1 helix-turn-helix domain-containing protein [Mobiluncus sp.]